MTPFIFSSFALRSEGVQNLDHKFLQFLPPALAVGDQLQFDFSPLLLTESIIMDKASFNALGQSKTPSFKSFYEQIRALLENGHIVLEDYDQLTEDEKIIIKNANDHEMLVPEKWLPQIRESFTTWDALSDKYSEAYGKKSEFSEICKLPFPLYEYLYEAGHMNNAKEEEAIREIVSSKRKRRTRSELEIIEFLGRVLLDHVHTGMVLRKKFNGAMYEWDNFRSTFVAKATASLEENALFNDVNGCKNFLDVVLPCQVKDLDLSKVINLLNDPEINNVRQIVHEYGTDNNFDIDRLDQMVMKALAKSNIRFQKKQRMSFWGKVASLTLGFFPGGSLAVDAALNIGQAAVGEAISNSGDRTHNDQELADVICVMYKHLGDFE